MPLKIHAPRKGSKFPIIRGTYPAKHLAASARPAFDRFREDFPGLPFALRETLLAGVVVENWSIDFARRLAWAIDVRARRDAENVDGAGI